MTVPAPQPVYRPTVVRSVSPPARPIAGTACLATRPAERRDIDDAAKLFKAVARGDVDGYHRICQKICHRICRTSTRTAGVMSMGSPHELKRFLDRAHTLIGKTDGNLLNHAVRTRPSDGKEACIALLVRDGIAANIPDARGFTPVMRLVRDERDTASLHKLVPSLTPADVNQVNAQDGYRTVLYYAIKAGNLPAVRALTAAGVNLNQACLNRSPVGLARKEGHMEIVRHLLIKGGREAASLSGSAIRPSWSLTSLVAHDAGESRRKIVARAEAPPPQPNGAEYGKWSKEEPDFLQVLTPESVRHAAP